MKSIKELQDVVVTSARRGTAFTEEEDNKIVELVKEAQEKGTTISVGDLRTALGDTRVYASVNARVKKLVKDGKFAEDAVIAGGKRVSFTDKEDEVLRNVLQEALKNKEQLTVKQITERFNKASSQERKEGSIRARLKFLVKAETQAS